MIITNEDIKVLEDIKDLIHGSKGNIEIIEKYDNLVNNFKKQKKEHANKQNAWNKNNKEYHNITNKITYYKSKNDDEKVEYWRKKLAEYKERIK
jgi:hypothetical protein